MFRNKHIQRHTRVHRYQESFIYQLDKKSKWEKANAVFQNIRGRLHDPRTQQLALLNHESEAREVGVEEQSADQDLVTAVVATGLIAAGTFVAPPLWFGGAGLVFYLMAKVATNAFQELVKEKRVTTNLLDFFLSTGVLIGGYFGVAAIGMGLFALSRKLVARTQHAAQQELMSVFGTQEQSVWVIVDGVEVEVSFEQVRVGDIVAVSAGQQVPVDGIIVDGVAAIDQHALTGESQLVEKRVGDQVLAATTIITGRLHICVEQAGDDTIAAKIGDILNNTLEFKEQITSKSETMANAAVIPTLGLSALALSFGGLSGALAILESSAGYNLRLTGPISMLNFLRTASKDSILIKDGRSIELLAQVDTVIFDKTGTLTLDELRVSSVVGFGDFNESAVLAFAASAEHRQSHPIAKAILSAAEAADMSLSAVEKVHIEVGYGIRVFIEGQVVQVGSDRFMEFEKIDLHSAARELQTKSQQQGCSIVFVAVDSVLIGAIELQPTVRPEAKAVLDDLRGRGLSLYIISGDQEEPTRNLAEKLGIEHYFANTLPEDKAKLVEQLQAEGKSVCFVGDGINDSIALKKANVSISLRGATTVATDVAQIVLMDGDLAKLPHLIKLSHQFTAVMKTNVWLSIVPAAVCGVGVFVFHWGLLSSFIIYDIGVFAGILNGTRVRLKTFEQKSENHDD